MTALRNALVAALRSLMKGKSFLQALLAFWSRPSSLKGARKSTRRAASAPESNSSRQAAGAAATATAAAAAASESTDTSETETATTPETTPATTPTTSPAASPSASLPKPDSATNPTPPTTTLDAFLQDAERLLMEPVQGDRLRLFARQLQDQFRDRLLTNAACMLPSYNHQLPTGRERGRYLSLDVGGSTLRVALIALQGRQDGGAMSSSPPSPPPSPGSSSNADTDADAGSMRILSMASFRITPELKQLEGMAFFDWMAGRILETVEQVDEENGHAGSSSDAPLSVGLAWSFPIEQTSLRGGLLQSMGKGFLAADSLLGRDLGDIIQAACRARGLHVALAAIVNDSTAALLSKAYVHAATRFSLILGTGVNIAAHLPVPTVGRAKFGTRPAAWFAAASHVIVNTELGMFGHGILPVTRWDALLNAGHPKPTFQPLEHMVSGYYLGEVCRFALLEAVATAGLFGGVAPPSLRVPYALDTATLSLIEDESTSLDTAAAVFQAQHPSAVPPTAADMAAVRTLASLVSRRSAAIVAASVYALWALKAETERAILLDLADADAVASTNGNANGHAKTENDGDDDDAVSPSVLATNQATNARAELDIVQARTVVAFNGSVIERYPHYLERCQTMINALSSSSSPAAGSIGEGQEQQQQQQQQQQQAAIIELVPAKESSLLGAAVALACLGA
ncbi:hexokinase-like protein [Niveomyces insectorum RCEF 264]|uniref:Hexokinase-like protein n=1 Tax=Niveomyces insectorum RCEF 264 TaxID=1081102 RepID=A0A167ZCX2_9HYPO|nr:hexokinase-like protein [Niveomyces insectorum RCEF 264]